MGVVDGKAAVVTGGGRGIGAGHAKWLAKEGASVVVNDIDLEEAQKTVDIINKELGKAVVNNDPIDTTEGAKKIVDHCVSEFGKIDAMVANAGILRDRTFLNMADQEMRDIFNVHVLGTFHTCQAAARQMREQGHGGVLITTTSGAHHGNFGQANYSGAKGWIASMNVHDGDGAGAVRHSRHRRVALGEPPGCAATALGPGGVPSPGGRQLHGPRAERDARGVALQRRGELDHRSDLRHGQRSLLHNAATDVHLRGREARRRSDIRPCSSTPSASSRASWRTSVSPSSPTPTTTG